MKKRVVALALATVMSLGAVASVGAAEEQINSSTGSATGKVTAEVKKLELPEEKTYLVTVSIPEMAFVYSFGTAGKWDTNALKYAEPEDAGWKGATTADITVTNKSDAPVKLNCVYEDGGAVTGVEGKITGGESDDGNKTLKSAVNEEHPLEEGTPDEVTFKLTISGTPDKEVTADTQIGTVTLTVSETV